jgi:hypothetical protein
MILALLAVFGTVVVSVVGVANPRLLAWALLLWIPIMGWVQLNLFNDSSVTVLLYEALVLAIYAAFAVKASRSPETFGAPPILWRAAPFIVWCLLLIPSSLFANGPVVTLIGLRTYLFPIGLVWVGYRAFENRRQLEWVCGLVMLQLPLIGAITASQVLGLTAITGSGMVATDVPVGFLIAGVIRPPGTFSAPGHLGNYLLFAIPFAVGLIGMRTRMSRRALFIAGLVGALAALVANTQRTTMTFLILMIPLMILMVRRAHQASGALLGIGVLVVGLAVGNEIVRMMFFDRFATIQDDFVPTVIENPMRAMDQALRSAVFGSGLGVASPGAARLITPQGIQQTDAADLIDPTAPAAEQFVAAVVQQTGVLGMILFAYFVWRLMREGWQAFRAAQKSDLAMLAAAILVYEIATCLQSWPYSPLHYPPARVVFWFWGGALLALPRLAQQGARQPTMALPHVLPARPPFIARPDVITPAAKPAARVLSRQPLRHGRG